jgi:molybdate transport system ATP-binding protein
VPGRNTELKLALQQQSPVALHAQLTCRGGELLALVGPSGSGKSTLLRMIAGLSRAAEGRIQCGDEIWFDAEAAVHLSPERRRVGFVPQDYGLFPHLSAQANVEAGLGHLPAQGRRSRAGEWLAKMRLAGLEHRLPDELSGGQQQRVAVARALAREPAILLLDEPFSALDRLTRETLYPELAELKQELAVPIVMVTHDLAEALLLADRMTLLDAGRTLQSGVPGEVLARPVSPAAARLMGHRNVLQGVLLRHEPDAGRSWIRAGQMELATPLSAGIPPGTALQWLLANGAVRLPGTYGKPLPESPNRVRLAIIRQLPMGEEMRLTVQLPGIAQPVELQIPARLAQALRLADAGAIDAVLREEALHLMPFAGGDTIRV